MNEKQIYNEVFNKLNVNEQKLFDRCLFKTRSISFKDCYINDKGDFKIKSFRYKAYSPLILPRLIYRIIIATIKSIFIIPCLLFSSAIDFYKDLMFSLSSSIVREFSFLDDVTLKRSNFINTNKKENNND